MALESSQTLSGQGILNSICKWLWAEIPISEDLSAFCTSSKTLTEVALMFQNITAFKLLVFFFFRFRFLRVSSHCNGYNPKPEIPVCCFLAPISHLELHVGMAKEQLLSPKMDSM